MTSFSKSTVYKIENAPASRFYQKYFKQKYVFLERGPYNLISALYPLGFVREQEDIVLRSPFNLKVDGSVELWGGVPAKRVQLMISVRKSLIEATLSAFRQAKALITKPTGVFIFDSIYRMKTIGAVYPRVVDTIKQEIGLDIPVVVTSSFYHIGILGSIFGRPYADVFSHHVFVLLFGKGRVYG